MTLLAVGRLKAGPERELLDRYVDRAQALSRQVGLTGVSVREIDESRSRTTADRRREEARHLLSLIDPRSTLVALDERGRPMPSDAFAGLVGRSRDEGCSDLCVIIGGPDGLDDSVRRAAAHLVAYGASTFPHQIVRFLAAEQIYRALTILAGHPYHRV